ARLGDSSWRTKLEAFHEVSRTVIGQFRGHLIKSTGDGSLATFDRPARAIRCAEALRRAVVELGLRIRSVLHAGEVEVLADDDIGGIAVHISARVSGMAGDSEILVSRTIRDLVVGSEIRFKDRGSHALRGVPGEWQLYAVEEPF